MGKTMLYKTNRFLYLVIRFTSLVLCIGLFLALMSRIWMKFIGNETVMTVKLDVEDITEKYPPCVTACPLSAFKKQGIHFDSSEFLKDTYDKEEIFYVNDEIDIFNSSQYYIEEISSAVAGRCYMVCSVQPLTINMWLYIPFRREITFKFFVHDRTDKMWIGFYFQPISMAVFHVDVSQSPGIFSVEGKILEKETTSLDKDGSPCKNYDHIDFNFCSKNVFTGFLVNNSYCTAPGIQLFLANDTRLKKCMDEESASTSVLQLLEKFAVFNKESWLKRCPVPCTQTTFQLKTWLFHKNNLLDKNYVKSLDNGGFTLSINYDSFTVERNIETLRYDLVDFLTQAGGNLGLFLGCSCFSILVFGLQIIRKLNFKRF